MPPSFGSTHNTFLRVLLGLFPLALLKGPGHLHGAHFDLAVGNGLAIQVGHDGLHNQRLTRLHKSARAAQTHVQGGGMHQQRRSAAQSLPVDILHHRSGRYAGGAWRCGAVEINAQMMFAGCIGARLINLAAGLPAFVTMHPPGRPRAEGVIAAIGGRVIRGRGRYVPIDLGVGQTATSIIIRRNGQIGMTLDEMRRGAGLDVDFVFGTAEFLHLNRVRELVGLVGVAFRRQ
jgi:hypothetical protein